MPRPDPLQNIMSRLRAHGGGDPNQQAARKADLTEHRSLAGAAPQGTMLPPQAEGMGAGGMPQDVMPQTPGAPDGLSPQFDEQPNMMGVIVDALNEAIIGLKTEIHRAVDPEAKRKMEKQAQRIRDAVIEMEGDPVWGDESIDEGLAKLRGLGAVNMLRPRDRAMRMREQGQGMPSSEQGVGQQAVPHFTEQPQELFPPQGPTRPMNVQWDPPETMAAPTAQQGQDYSGGWLARRRQIFERMQRETGAGGGA